MAKKTETATKAKAPKAPKIDITFGAWIKTVARARGDIADFVKSVKADKKIDETKDVKFFDKKFAGNEAYMVAKGRYDLFRHRGSQAGRVRKSAEA